MTKAVLIEKIYLKTGFGKNEASDRLEEVLELIKSTLERGEDIKIVGFGTFVVRDKAASRGRNPQTGEKIEIPSRKVLTFKPSPVLRGAINAQRK